MACLVESVMFGFCLTCKSISRTAAWSAGLDKSLLRSFLKKPDCGLRPVPCKEAAFKTV